MNELRTILNRALAVGTVLLGSAGSLAAQDANQIARRVAAVATLAVEEYRLGVRDGRIVQAAEYEESVLFLQNARADAAGLPPEAAPVVVARLDSMLLTVNRVGDPGRLVDLVAAMRDDLERDLGVTLDPPPSAAPSLATGEAV